MRILYASERPHPFFLGEAARCPHQLLHGLATDLGIECTVVGSRDYALIPLSLPDSTDHATIDFILVVPT